MNYVIRRILDIMGLITKTIYFIFSVGVFLLIPDIPKLYLQVGMGPYIYFHSFCSAMKHLEGKG
jgi:hypothetical protein